MLLLMSTLTINFFHCSLFPKRFSKEQNLTVPTSPSLHFEIHAMYLSQLIVTSPSSHPQSLLACLNDVPLNLLASLWHRTGWAGSYAGIYWRRRPGYRVCKQGTGQALYKPPLLMLQRHYNEKEKHRKWSLLFIQHYTVHHVCLLASLYMLTMVFNIFHFSHKFFYVYMLGSVCAPHAWRSSWG